LNERPLQIIIYTFNSELLHSLNSSDELLCGLIELMRASIDLMHASKELMRASNESMRAIIDLMCALNELRRLAPELFSSTAQNAVIDY
jgi:hypothetical protein